mmetsp:Transcript_15798/g.24257  ORF Transcript_15798/g.24257 Transcript_15798/m.24257 type:complete len:249 (+) Transcript_15798:86-832(+)
MMNPRLLHLFLLMLCCVIEIDAFVPILPAYQVSSRGSLHALLAKKKRRRKQKDDSLTNPKTPPTQTGRQGGDSDELPDFDIEPKANSEAQKPADTGKFAASVSLDGSKITDAQMGAVTPLSSFNDLMNDRSLEKEMSILDEPTDGNELPSFAAYLERTAGDPEQVMGKKKARRAERRAAAIESKEEEKKNINILSKIPFIGIEEDEKLSPLKTIETITWFGIFILVLWEFYINSPLFERIQPMTPVLF